MPSDSPAVTMDWNDGRVAMGGTHKRALVDLYHIEDDDLTTDNLDDKFIG